MTNLKFMERDYRKQRKQDIYGFASCLKIRGLSSLEWLHFTLRNLCQEFPDKEIRCVFDGICRFDVYYLEHRYSSDLYAIEKCNRQGSQVFYQELLSWISSVDKEINSMI